ncbi:MAG: hypothetical protein ABJE95_01425 [Byssovorax sp.]
MVSLRHPLSRTALLALSLTSLLLACGGKVVVDGAATPGEGGKGGGSSTTGTGTNGPTTVAGTGVGGSGGACAGLQADVTATLAAAQACNPAINAPQCSGTNVVADLCGCPVVANDSAFSAAQLANMAFTTWVNAGCGPFECFACPPPPSSPWFCDPTASICKPAFEK